MAKYLVKKISSIRLGGRDKTYNYQQAICFSTRMKIGNLFKPGRVSSEIKSISQSGHNDKGMGKSCFKKSHIIFVTDIFSYQHNTSSFLSLHKIPFKAKFN